MIDIEINKTLKELSEIFKPKFMDKLASHLFSLERQIEDLRKSRDNWKDKYNRLKK